MVQSVKQETMKHHDEIGIDEKEMFEIFVRENLIPLFSEGYLAIHFTVRPYYEEGSGVAETVHLDVEAFKVIILGEDNGN